MSELNARMAPEEQVAARIKELEAELEVTSVEALNWRDMLSASDMIINGLMKNNSALKCEVDRLRSQLEVLR